MFAAHPNKFAVFHGGKAQGILATADEAYAWALDSSAPTRFLVAKVAPPREGSVIARAPTARAANLLRAPRTEP